MKISTQKHLAVAVLGSLLLMLPALAPAEDAAAEKSLIAFDNAPVLSADELGDERAKQAITVDHVQINDNDLDGTVGANTALDNTTGHNSISGDAFAGASGFVSTVQNSGNNVLIQNATIINVSVEP